MNAQCLVWIAKCYVPFLEVFLSLEQYPPLPLAALGKLPRFPRVCYHERKSERGVDSESSG